MNYTRNLTDGIFFIPVADFKLYYTDLVISTYYESWVNSVYTQWSDDGLVKRYDFNLTSSITAPGFIGIDLYNIRMYPNGCRPSYPNIDMQIFMNGKSFQVWKMLNDYQFYGFQSQ